MIISRVISGGQNGVDQAALRAAKARGVPTGGVMPRGFKTLDGPRPELAELYGMTEHASDKYPPRTRANVEAADITVRIATNFRSPGEVATLRAVMSAKKPHLDVRMRRRMPGGGSGWGYVLEYDSDLSNEVIALKALARQLGRPLVVNFAGNSEQTAPNIGINAEIVVGLIFDGCNKETGIE